MQEELSAKDWKCFLMFSQYVLVSIVINTRPDGEMTQIAEAACRRQGYSSQLKAEACKLLTYLAGHEISPKEQKTRRGTSTLDELWKPSKNRLVNRRETGKGRAEKRKHFWMHQMSLKALTSKSFHLLFLTMLWDVRLLLWSNVWLSPLHLREIKELA